MQTLLAEPGKVVPFEKIPLELVHIPMGVFSISPASRAAFSGVKMTRTSHMKERLQVAARRDVLREGGKFCYAGSVDE